MKTKQNVAFFPFTNSRFLTHVSQTHAPFLDSNRGRKSSKLHHRKSLTVVFWDPFSKFKQSWNWHRNRAFTS